MDQRDDKYIPEGWTKKLRNNRVVFVTDSKVVIQGKTMLKDYQRLGRFCEADAEKLDFRQHASVDRIHREIGQLEEVNTDEPMEVDNHKATFLVKRSVAEHEKCVIEEGTKRLQIDPANPVNHISELENVSKILSDVLGDSDHLELCVDVESLKEDLAMAVTKEQFINTLVNNPQIVKYFSVLSKARSLSEMLNLPLESSSPLIGWPPSVNENIYCEIIKLANCEAREVLSFLCNLLLPKDKPIEKDDVIRVADMFGTLAHTASKNQNALSKFKSLVLQKEGLSSAGLDRLAKLKGAECSTTLSKGRHMLVELGEAFFRSRVQQGKSFTTTVDNLNLKSQNMTQSVLIIEQDDTHHLSSEPMDPSTLPKSFETSNFLLSAPQNNEMLLHFKNAVSIKVGNILAGSVKEASKLKRFLASRCSDESRGIIVPSEVFIPPPDYLNETDNAEFFQFCLKKQGEFLSAVSESAVDKDAFLSDLDLVKCTKVVETGILETEAEVKAREDAEERVRKQVERFGRWIGYGDALTYKQFWLGAKALAQGNCTAFERLEYLSHFRLALFHAKMNKVNMDYPCMMPRKSMLEDEGTMPEMVALAGIQGISTEEKKISNSFEKHDQLLMCMGHLYVTNMFLNYISDEPTAYEQVVDEDSAKYFVLEMLEKYDIELYFDPGRVGPSESKWDDPANYGRDIISRMILSEIFDVGEEDEDALLLRSLRIIMIVYFLNRKYKCQDSKYAYFLLMDEVLEKQASERDKERMNKTMCVNPSGRRGGGLFT